jgi:hypothetical protein
MGFNPEFAWEFLKWLEAALKELKSEMLQRGSGRALTRDSEGECQGKRRQKIPA